MSDVTQYSALTREHRAIIDSTGADDVTVVRAGLIRALHGNGNAAILLSQFLWWSRHNGDEDGWFYFTRDHIESKCGLGERSQRTARAFLVRMGLIDERRHGMPARIHYRINFTAVVNLVIEADSPVATLESQQDATVVSRQVATHARQPVATHASRQSLYKSNDRESTRACAREDSPSLDWSMPEIDTDDPVDYFHLVYASLPPAHPHVGARITAMQQGEVRAKVTDLGRWRDALELWIRSEYAVRNVRPLIERYVAIEEEANKPEPFKPKLKLFIPEGMEDHPAFNGNGRHPTSPPEM